MKKKIAELGKEEADVKTPLTRPWVYWCAYGGGRTELKKKRKKFT